MLLSCVGCSQTKAAVPQVVDASSEETYWPTTAWRTSTPEAQGMDSSKLNSMFETIQKRGLDLHHVMVIRNGVVVVGADYYPYSRDDLHIVNSVTKSFTSAVIGKLIDEGLIKSVEEPVISYFDDITIANPSPLKSKLLLKHLLTMTAGFEWTEDGNYGATYDSYTLMSRSPHPYRYILDQPVLTEPGSEFYYNTGASHLLSSIVTQVMKKTEEHYALEKILKPIGIDHIFWRQDKDGINSGGSGLFVSVEDLARFGYLFLNQGKWDNAQILSEAWISESTQKQVETPNGLAGRDGYGYQWWQNSFGGYSARGYAGQYLFVMPEENMVVVFMSSLPGSKFFMPETLVGDFIKPAILSNAPLPENKTAFEALSNTLEDIKKAPEALLVSELPVQLKSVSGKIYPLEAGEKIGLDFLEGADVATLHWFVDGIQYDVPVGLDGVYRMSDCPDFYIAGLVSSVGFRGKVVGQNSFAIDIRPVESDSVYTLTLNWEGDEMIKSFRSNLE
jgi:CubicO group peptidase (beta-lactamase class C family)